MADSPSPSAGAGEQAFAIDVVLDPALEDREALRRWPLAQLQPDYLVATSGWVRLAFGGVPVAYRAGRYVALRPGERLPVGATDRLPDYVGGFAQRLAEALVALDSEGSRFVQMIDSPAGLALSVDGERAIVAYREGANAADLARADLSRCELRPILLGALQRFVGSLIALNPALERQPDVARLRETIRRGTNG
jgi:hypothetical protein